MSVTERALVLYTVLNGARNGLTLEALTRELGCDASSFYRVRRECENLFGVDIRNDRKYRTYHLDKTEKIGAPGLWFRPEELAGLLAMSQWMESLGAHVLRDRLEPLRADLESKLRARGISPKDWVERIRVLPMHLRAADPRLLLTVADAVLRRRRLSFEYRGARKDEWRAREVSPQTIVHYRDTWYLDAFDHEQAGLRLFALHRMRELGVLAEAAMDVPRAELDAHSPTGTAYSAERPPASLSWSSRARRPASWARNSGIRRKTAVSSRMGGCGWNFLAGRSRS